MPLRTELIKFRSTLVGNFPTVFEDFLRPVCKILNYPRQTLESSEYVAATAVFCRLHAMVRVLRKSIIE